MRSGRRLALLVASSVYADAGLRRLRSPVTDAEALRAVLADPRIGGFEAKLVVDRPSYEVAEQIEELFSDRHHDDLVVLYVSCHGVKDDDGRLYFAATNTKLRRLAATAVPSTFIAERMDASRSRRVILLLDCCYSGAFGRMTPKSDRQVGVTERFSGRGRAVITASSAMEYAFEDARLALDASGTSVFTDAMVRGLRTGEADLNGDGQVSTDELYDYVYEQVRHATPDQTPTISTSVEGELVIASSPRGPRTGAPAVTAAPSPPLPVAPALPPPLPPDTAGPRPRRFLRPVVVVPVVLALVAALLAVVLTAWAATPRWTGLTGLPTALEGAGVAAFGGRLWVAGGVADDDARTLLDAVSVYDPAGARWSDGPRLPQGTAFAALVPADGRLYLIGGQTARGAVATVLRLDSPDGSWVEDVPLPQPREAGAAAFDGSRLVYAGGVGTDHATSADVLTLDGGTWRTAGRLQVAREKAAAATDGFGTVWVIGGRDRSSGVPAFGAVDVVSVDRVSPGDPVSPVHSAAAVWWPGTGVCVAGGETWTGLTDAVSCLRGATGPAPLPTARAGLGAAAIGGDVFVVGGYGTGTHGSTDVAVYRTGR